MQSLDNKPSLKEKCSFLMNYLEKGINSKNISHCILFYGSDIETQYEIALETARMLNCTELHTTECQCLNCKWIRENKHPAVMTVSRLDNKPSGDTSKTVISVEQARMIKNDLSITSDYHRVLIFCDKDDDGNILGLNRKNFQEEASNALLKTFEEPPENTTFIFLTKDKSDIIDTIVSRTQVFYVPSLIAEDKDFSLVNDVMDGYLNIDRNDVLDFNEKLLAVLRENEPLYVFCQMQNYIENLLKSNLKNAVLKTKLIKDLKSIEKAKKQYELNMNLQTICEDLCFNIILD